MFPDQIAIAIKDVEMPIRAARQNDRGWTTGNIGVFQHPGVADIDTRHSTSSWVAPLQIPFMVQHIDIAIHAASDNLRLFIQINIRNVQGLDLILGGKVPEFLAFSGISGDAVVQRSDDKLERAIFKQVIGAGCSNALRGCDLSKLGLEGLVEE